MQRRINNLHFLTDLTAKIPADDLLLQFLHIAVVDLTADHKITSCADRFHARHRVNLSPIAHGIHLIDDLRVLRRRNLRSVVPVNLISVVLCGVVARRHDDTCDASEFSHGKGKFRRRTKRFKTVCLDPVRGKAKCSLLTELDRHTTGIIRDCNALLCAAFLQNEVCKTLCCLANRVNVHAVRTGADDTAESAGTELEASVKPLADLILIAFDRFQFCLGSLVKIRILTPETIFIHKLHLVHPPCINLCRSAAERLLCRQYSTKFASLHGKYQHFPLKSVCFLASSIGAYRTRNRGNAVSVR